MEGDGNHAKKRKEEDNSADSSSSSSVDGGDDEIVRIWDYNTTGYYLRLQKWNVGQEFNRRSPGRIEPNNIDISPCSRYVVVLFDRHVLLKDRLKSGKTIKSMLLPKIEKGRQIKFSLFDGHYSIVIRSKNIHNNQVTIKIWCLFDDLLTTLEHPNTRQHLDIDFAVSRDNSMIAICATEEGKGRIMIYYPNNSATNSTLSFKQSFSVRLKRYLASIRFTPDGKYLYYLNQDRLLVFLHLITGSEVTDQMNLSYHSKEDNMCLTAIGFSPVGCGRRILIEDKAPKGHISRGCYIATIWESS